MSLQNKKMGQRPPLRANAQVVAEQLEMGWLDLELKDAYDRELSVFSGTRQKRFRCIHQSR